MPEIMTYITYSEIFGRSRPLDEIIDSIRQLPSVTQLLPVVAMLADKGHVISHSPSLTRKLARGLQQILSEKYPERARVISEILSMKIREPNRVLYSDRAAEFLMKLLLVYGEVDISRTDVHPERDLFQALWLLLLVSDHLDSIDDPVPHLFRLAVLSATPNLVHSITRTLTMFLEIAKDPSICGASEYLDIHDLHLERFGYSLDDFIAASLMLLAAYKAKPEEHEIEEYWGHPIRNVVEAFASTSLALAATDIIKSISVTPEQARNELEERALDPNHMVLFLSYPLLLFPGDNVMPLSSNSLENILCDGIFWRVRGLLPEKDMSFHDFFGHIFETYVRQLVKATCQNSLFRRCKYVEKFEYGSRGNQRRSPDVLMTVSDALLAFEVKAKRVPYSRIVLESSPESFERCRLDMQVDPMCQLNNRVNEILSTDLSEIDAKTIKEVYLIVVTHGDFPWIPRYAEQTMADWDLMVRDNARPTRCYSMSAEELEQLCFLWERSKRPITRLLKRRTSEHNKTWGVFFSTFTDSKVRMPSYLYSKWDQQQDWVRQYFPELASEPDAK